LILFDGFVCDPAFIILRKNSDCSCESPPLVHFPKGFDPVRGQTFIMKPIILATLAITALVQPALSSTETYAKLAPKIAFGLDAPHLHLLTNHLPIFVTLSGLFAMAVGLWSKNQGIRQVALTLMFLGIAGGILTFWFGQQAYNPVRGLADEIGQDWLDLHMERAEQVVWVFWTAGAGVAAAWVLAWKQHRLAIPAAMVAGMLGLITLGLSGWIADAGGKIRHDELRGLSSPQKTDVEREPHSH
jgi:hypothetical protein